jgi:2-phosphosulfolactate phosphatase
MTVFAQEPCAIRCEWALQGIQELISGSDVVIVVDIFSFCTAVDIATANGAIVYPYQGRCNDAPAYATSKDAILASSDRTRDEYSLSPASLLTIPSGARLVLRSLNGSRLSLATGDIPTFAGCLRNAEAVACAAQQGGRMISVIPAGERWKRDGTIRFALEDWIGAGAIIHFLDGSRSPEALAAESVFRSFRNHLHAILATTGSGQELMHGGFEQDVALALDFGSSHTIPRLRDGAYIADSSDCE